MAKITSEMQPLSQILVRSSDQFIIPDFQRAFVWTDEEANNLINDFIEQKEYYEESDYKITSSIVEALTTAVNTVNDTRRVQLQTQYQPPYSVQDLWLESNINERGQNIAKLLEFALTN